MNLPLLFKKLYVLLKLRNEMNRTSQQCIPTIPGFGMFELQDLGEINISYLSPLVQDDENSGQSYPGYTRRRRRHQQINYITHEPIIIYSTSSISHWQLSHSGNNNVPIETLLNHDKHSTNRRRHRTTKILQQ